MKTLILDGATGHDPTGAAVHSALLEDLRIRGATVESVRIAEKHIGPCMGDFFCWVRSPGQCALDDDNRAIAQAFAQSDLVVFLTPVTFGGYSSELKRALDHMIQLISPFFTTVDGETHHAKRYERYPRLLGLGWQERPDGAAEGIFHHLVKRNAVNVHAPASVSGVVHAGWRPSQVRQAVADWVDAVAWGSGHVAGLLPQVEASPAGTAPGRALLLTGSPKGKRSTSQSLGGYLLDRLEGQGIQPETIRLYTALKSKERRRALLEAVDRADLVVLAFPLYVDCLPAPVISILELIAAHRRESPPSKPQAFTALANCGFPEAKHNETSLAICGTFAREAGFLWAGGLALGGGQGVVSAVPLTELGGRAATIRLALDRTAEALANGGTVPADAMALMSTRVIPAWVYRTWGWVGWRLQARRHAAHRKLGARPYA